MSTILLKCFLAIDNLVIYGIICNKTSFKGVIMKKYTGKIYKIIALIIGILGGFGSIYITYLLYTMNSSSTRSLYILLQYSFYCFSPFIACMLFYAISHIIELLHSINNQVSSLATLNEPNKKLQSYKTTDASLDLNHKSDTDPSTINNYISYENIDFKYDDVEEK